MCRLWDGCESLALAPFFLLRWNPLRNGLGRSAELPPGGTERSPGHVELRPSADTSHGIDDSLRMKRTEWSDAERKVVSSFLDGQRLTRIPAKKSKRDVILRWLLTEFEPGVEYPEAEVNRKLRRHHPDCATLRRELFESGYLHRRGGGGVYWRRIDEEGDDSSP